MKPCPRSQCPTSQAGNRVSHSLRPSTCRAGAGSRPTNSFRWLTSYQLREGPPGMLGPRALQRASDTASRGPPAPWGLRSSARSSTRLGSARSWREVTGGCWQPSLPVTSLNKGRHPARSTFSLSPSAQALQKCPGCPITSPCKQPTLPVCWLGWRMSGPLTSWARSAAASTKLLMDFWAWSSTEPRDPWGERHKGNNDLGGALTSGQALCHAPCGL